MSNTENRRPHWSFWVIGGIALIWNVMTAINFVVQMNPDMIEMYRETERAMIVGRPAWATAAFAIAAFAGALGSVLLLLRKSYALYLFAISMLGVIVVMIHSLTADIDFGAGEIVGIIILPIAVAAFLIWYSRYTHSNRWIS